MIAQSELGHIFFGCGNFGGLGSSPDLRDKGDGREAAMTLLDHASAIGLTKFDTANTYGGGDSERLLGEWLASKTAAFRAKLQVATKVGNPHGCPDGDTPLSRAQVAQHLDESLRRLGLEQIGLYYVHEFDHVTPLEETLEAMDRALAAGKIAEFGVSNASLDDLKGVLALTSGELRVEDTVTGQGRHEIVIRWQLAAGSTVRVADRTALVTGPAGDFSVTVAATAPVRLAAETRAVATGFGSTADAPVLTCRMDAALAVGVTTVWSRARGGAGGERAT